MKPKFRSPAIAIVLAFILALPHEAVAAERPQKKERSYFEARGEVVWEVPMDKKWIALTFDDGPDSDQTAEILDLLKQYRAKATFFVIGAQVRLHPEIARREAEEGHELANHSFHHRMLQRASAEKIKAEIDEAEQTIFEASGIHSRLFRPPGGYYNETIVNTARDAGYTVIMWSWHQDTRDWARPGVKRIVDKVLNNARPGDIVLFHDRVEGSQTIKALKEILPELRQRGYEFVTVSDLLNYSKKSNEAAK
jgi:polysaccharide deacetylase family sporulation protein PdaB